MSIILNKIRVLHCLQTVGSGGVEQRRLSLAKHLDPERFDQYLVCTKAIGGLPRLYEQAGCKIFEVGDFRGIFDWERYRSALEIVKEIRPHIIHGAVYEGVALAAIAGRMGRVPIVIGEETSDPQNRSWKGSLLYRGLTSLTDHMVAVSPATFLYLNSGIRIPQKKISLILNGVAEKPAAKPEAVNSVRHELGLVSEDFIIGTVGRLFDIHKRVSDLIRAMPIIIRSAPRAKLLVVGSGPDEAYLRTLAKELGIESQVVFAGYQACPQAYYGAMDLFALASASEAFGLVLVEAMFAGLPVVATRVGGIPSVVSEGDTALLVPPSAPDEIAVAVLNLFFDQNKARHFGAQGRLRAHAKFSEERYVDDVSNLYEKLLVKHQVI